MFKVFNSFERKNNSFSKVTIFITAYIRRKNLPKLLNSLKNTNLNIIVLDSSPTLWNCAEKFSWAEYRHSPNALFYEVLFNAAKICNTKYCLWLCDDDFINLNGLKKCIDFFEANKEYSSVTGRLKKRISKYGLYEYRAWMKNYNFPTEDPIVRIDRMFKCFCTPVHDLMKKEHFQKCFEIVLENPNYYPMRFFDRITGLVQAIYGNKKVINCVLLNRGRNTGKDEIEKRQLEWAEYPKMLRREVMPEMMIEEIKKNDPFPKLINELHDIDYNYSHAELIKILDSYYKSKRYLNHNYNKKLSKLERLANFLKKSDEIKL